MKLLAIALGLLVVPGLTAQEQQRPAPAADNSSRAAQAPKLGHPLDPADVDVLTGKNKSRAYSDSESRREVNPYGPYGRLGPWGDEYYGYGRLNANPSIFAAVTTKISPPFSLVFAGRFRNRPVILFGGAPTPLFLGRFHPVWRNRLPAHVRPFRGR